MESIKKKKKKRFRSPGKSWMDFNGKNQENSQVPCDCEGDGFGFPVWRRDLCDEPAFAMETGVKHWRCREQYGRWRSGGGQEGS